MLLCRCALVFSPRSSPSLFPSLFVSPLASAPHVLPPHTALQVMAPYKAQQGVTVLEIGVKKGGSLKLWREYFSSPSARIIGTDIDPGVPSFPSDVGVKVLILDSTDLAAVRRSFGVEAQLDVVVDDGCHRLSCIKQTFMNLRGLLKPDGVCVKSRFRVGIRTRAATHALTNTTIHLHTRPMIAVSRYVVEDFPSYYVDYVKAGNDWEPKSIFAGEEGWKVCTLQDLDPSSFIVVVYPPLSRAPILDGCVGPVL